MYSQNFDNKTVLCNDKQDGNVEYHDRKFPSKNCDTLFTTNTM